MENKWGSELSDEELEQVIGGVNPTDAFLAQARSQFPMVQQDVLDAICDIWNKAGVKAAISLAGKLTRDVAGAKDLVKLIHA